MTIAPLSRAQTRAEQFVDAAIHLVGITGALLAVPVLVALAVIWRGDGPLVAAVIIYGASLIAMLALSASYNLATIRLEGGRALDWLRRLDHATIYVKIAGTYTPYGVIAGGAVGKWLLIGVWSGAAVGVLAKLLAPHRWRRSALALYLGLGWAFLLAAGPISAAINETTLRLIAVGGVLYTVGVLFHVWERLPFQNAIWHLFVLLATAIFYAALVVEMALGG